MQSKRLVFLDTETTSLEDGRLIELAYAIDGTGIEVIRSKPPEPISVEAMSVHHITLANLEHLPSFQDNASYTSIKSLLESSVVIAHNAPFDLGVLAREGIICAEYIDTRRVAQHLYPELPKHSLQYLRYYLEIYDLQDAEAHSADGDVRVLIAVFNTMKRKMEQDTEYEPIERMIELTKTLPLLVRVNFGKHRGETWAEVNRTDRNYIEWLFKNPHEDETIRATVNYWMMRR